MYCINDEQIDFILSDISARGIEMVGLQQDLLDHICCIIEHNLDDDGDFESFYDTTIKDFYRRDLKEIEEETINLLIHKNYYVMKKIMLASGGFSAALLTLGILFKFMHWPGALMLLFCGILVLSFIFLPLSFVLRAKEKKEKKDKIVIGLGVLAAISLSLGVLFKVMHWPFANILCMVSLLIMILLFLPIYYLSGIRNPETKVNTMVSSMLIIAGSALILTLVRSPQGSKKRYLEITSAYLRNEQILENEQKITALTNNSISADFSKSSQEVYRLCSELKAYLLKKETGLDKIDTDFEVKNTLISDSYTSEFIAPHQVTRLKAKIEDYNSKVAESQKIPVANSIFEENNQRIEESLNNLTQVQMMVLQNQRMN
ncbi:MAG: hypothetical protein M0D53_17330 [Flavobacterium sp. JAD_PAG50586_2]|nr:MAG: hypothetical protein M0D53_17330 [Flavobacterium sp. JAD_PAG50586_2]